MKDFLFDIESASISLKAESEEEAKKKFQKLIGAEIWLEDGADSMLQTPHYARIHGIFWSKVREI